MLTQDDPPSTDNFRPAAAPSIYRRGWRLNGGGGGGSAPPLKRIGRAQRPPPSGAKSSPAMTASALASFTLDSIGPLARSVADCEPVSVAGLRFGLAEGLPLGGLGDTVDGRGQCQGRHRAARSARHSSRPPQAARRRSRPECPRSHRARLCGSGVGLHRDGPRARASGASAGSPPCRHRCAGHADDSDRRARDRQWRTRGRSPRAISCSCATPRSATSSTSAPCRCRFRWRFQWGSCCWRATARIACCCVSPRQWRNCSADG